MTSEVTLERGGTPRRSIASAKRIQESIQAAQACGLTPTSISHQPDGTIVISFGEDSGAFNKDTYKPKGWDI